MPEVHALLCAHLITLFNPVIYKLFPSVLSPLLMKQETVEGVHSVLL